MEKKLLIFSSDATKSHHTISHFAHLKINKIELNYTIHASANGLLNEKMKKRKLAKIMMQTIIKKRQLVCVFCIRFNASRTTSLQVCCESAPPNDCTKRRKPYAWDLACSQNEENYSTVFFSCRHIYLITSTLVGAVCVSHTYHVECRNWRRWFFFFWQQQSKPQSTPTTITVDFGNVFVIHFSICQGQAIAIQPLFCALKTHSIQKPLSFAGDRRKL